MNFKHLLIVSSLFLSLTSSAQSYDSLALKAFQEYYPTKNYNKAAKLYDQAFSTSDSVNLDHYYYATCAFSMAGHIDKAFSCLSKMVANGYMDFSLITKDSDNLISLHTDKRWPDILEDIKKNYAEYEKDLDVELRHKIQAMLDYDQGLRKSWGELSKEFGEESQEVDSIKKHVDTYRQIHTDTLMAIYERNGFPDHSIIGKDGLSNLHTLAVHSHDIEFQKLTLVYLATEASHGGIDWESVAFLTDRMRYHEDKPQYFGTRFKNVNWPENGVELYTVIDISHLDRRRKALGLVPIKQMYESWGYDLINLPEQK